MFLKIFVCIGQSLCRCDSHNYMRGTKPPRETRNRTCSLRYSCAFGSLCVCATVTLVCDSYTRGTQSPRKNRNRTCSLRQSYASGSLFVRATNAATTCVAWSHRGTIAIEHVLLDIRVHRVKFQLWWRLEAACVCECVCVCVCVWEREIESAWVWERKRERERVKVSDWEREGERDRQRNRAWICVSDATEHVPFNIWMHRVRETEIERERVCGCARACERKWMCTSHSTEHVLLSL